MTEYRIVELHRRFHIEERINGKEWHDVRFENVPRFFETLADARSWVATIKRGVVYHDAEDAPNLAQDERKAECDTSDGIKPLWWFLERIDHNVVVLRKIETFVENSAKISDRILANAHHELQFRAGYRYKDQP